MSPFQWRNGAAALLAASLGFPAWAAGPLTLPEAQALALARSRQLAAADASIAASRELAVAAGQLPDPTLKFGIENLPASGPDRLSLSRDFMTMRRIGLSQELPAAGKRRLRSERLEREAERARAEKLLSVTRIERETALAWIDRHYTEAMRALLRQQINEAELQVQAAQSGYGIGRSTQVEVIAARSARVALQDRLSQADKQARNALSMLERWIGGAASGPIDDAAPAWQASRFDQQSLEEHLAYHPDLVAARARVAAAKTDVQLAQANKRADWSVEAMYSQRGPGYSNMVSIGVSVPLQWDQKSRQDRELAAKLALVDEATASYEEMRRQHEAETLVLLNEWETGKARVARQRDELVPLAGQRTEAAVAAYRSGKSDLASTLAARREEIDARMQALAVEMETARAWAQLNFLIPEHNAHGQEKP